MPQTREAASRDRGEASWPPALGLATTPLQFNAALSLETGVETWIKRDDLQDTIGSGVKRRAIAATLAYRAETGGSPIVIDGVPQSNCLMAMVHYCDEENIPLVVILRGSGEIAPVGNYARIARSRARVVRIADASELGAARDALVREVGRPGSACLVVPAGAAAPWSMAGPLGLGCEIAEQARQHGIEFDTVVLPIGTGGTAAGLAVSRYLHAAAWSMIAIRIDGFPRSDYVERCRAYSSAFFAANDWPEPLAAYALPFLLHDDALGTGYARFTSEDVAESERLLATTGCYFGPTYMLKALRGLKQLVARGTIGGTQRVLLIHTGGTNERDALRGTARERPPA